MKVISVCRVHVFFHQYVADLREERSGNVLRTFAASPFIFDMTVSSTSGVITTPPESSAGEVQPLNTGVNILHGVNTVSFIIPPVLGIERPVMQLQEFRTCRTSGSRPSFSLLSLSASSSALTLPRKPAKFSSSSLSIDRSQPLRGTTSPPPGETLLPPPADDCFRVWMIQTLPCGVSRFRGQSPLVPCLHMRRSGMCRQPDPPVLPTGSVFRIYTSLPERSFTSATPLTPGEDGSRRPGLPSHSCSSSESGDLLYSDGNPAYVLMLLPIQGNKSLEIRDI